MDDLWPTFTSTDAEKNNAISILREQARALENKTDKKVKATFSKVTYSEGLSNTFNAIARCGSFFQETEEIFEPELKDKKNIADLYKTTCYKFEIFNNTYRFRLFLLQYRELFPVELIPDEGIKAEIDSGKDLIAKNNTELKEIVSAIFSSEKVKTIILHMMADPAK